LAEPYYKCIYNLLIDVTRSYLEKNMLGVGISIEESFQALVIKKLCLFRKLSIPSFVCVDPLAWWCIHETQFLNVDFLGKNILEIPSSQIEIEHVFNLLGC
jgi:hypothetical protein